MIKIVTIKIQIPVRMDFRKKGGRPNPNDSWPELEEMALNKTKMDWYQDWILKARKNFHIEIKQ